jgi:hypothetical protein
MTDNNVTLDNIEEMVSVARQAEIDGDLTLAFKIYAKLAPYVATKVKPIVTVSYNRRPNQNEHRGD